MAIARLRDAIGGRADDSDEAVIRFAGYLAGSDYGGIVSESSVESATVTYSVNHADAFRRSGAAGLLSPWRIRRAGAIG